MPDWVIWVAIAVVFMSWRRSRACCGMGVTRIRGHRERMRDRMTKGDTTGMESQPMLASGRREISPIELVQACEEWLGGGPQLRSQNGEAMATRRETPLEALQRKFVSGPMTLEQYEAELDKLDRLE